MQKNIGITSLDFSSAEHIEKIGFYAFEGCTGISNDLVIPSTVTELREGAFMNCTSIPSADIQANISVIEWQTFYNCASLTTVQLPDTVTEIQPFAFASCPELTYIELSKNVTDIAVSAFRDDLKLTIGVWYGSYAYNYVKDNDIPYKLLDGVRLGDVNGDGSIDVNDVTMIQKHIAGLTVLDGIYLYSADTNLDTDVDIIDATVTQKHIAGYELAYPVGEIIRR